MPLSRTSVHIDVSERASIQSSDLRSCGLNCPRMLKSPPAFLWAILASALLLCGCLTIEENYTFKKNGSGTMEYVVDMSALADMMKSMDLGGKNEKDEPDAMGLRQQAGMLKDVAGLKHVRMKEQKDGYVQRVSFAFQDIAALNRALNILMPDSTGVQQEFFRWDGNSLVRTNNGYMRGVGGEIGGDGDSLNLEGMLTSMKYKYSFKFADAVGDARLAEGMEQERPSRKKLELATDWSVISKDPKALDLRITLDK